MNDVEKLNALVAKRRALLSMATGVAGLATASQWTKPVVETIILPAHAQTTDNELAPPRIFNLRLSSLPEECQEGSPGVFFGSFNIEYSFTSEVGIVSHVITALCGDDTLSVAGSPTSVGINLIEDGSFDISGTPGNQFGGDVLINTNSVSGPDPLECAITVTITDANGNTASAPYFFEECDF